MRTIKFRAWDDHKKIMIDPYCELKDGNFWGADCTNTGISVKHEHVMQFTGLLDSEGDKIYESDIVGVFMDRLGDSYPNFKENDYMVCEVIFENGGFHAVNFNKEMQFPLWAVAKEALIKLGNIYENPDLLK